MGKTTKWTQIHCCSIRFNGLTDLDKSKEYVRQRIADYFVDLLSIGIKGFRVDLAKHIHPIDLTAFFKKFKDGMGGDLPDDWFTWLEVLTGREYQLLIDDSEYSFSIFFENQMKKKQGLTTNYIDKEKIWWNGYQTEPWNDNGRVSMTRIVIQFDGSSSRDMHAQGCVLVKGCSPETHRALEVHLFENSEDTTDNDNDYQIRMVLSSYYFENDVKSIPERSV